MSFCAPIQASCPLIHAGPVPVLVPSWHYRWPARACCSRRRWRGSQNFAGSLCMVGTQLGPLGMMGRQLAARCMTDTCDHARVVEENLMACHSLNKVVWDTGCISCPCALHVRWAVLGGTEPSTRRCRWNLASKLQVWCLLKCAGWKSERSR